MKGLILFLTLSKKKHTVPKIWQIVENRTVREDSLWQMAWKKKNVCVGAFMCECNMECLPSYSVPKHGTVFIQN